MARQLTAEAEVGVIRAFSKFPKIFNTQLPLTKGYLAHFVLGPVSTCVRERRWEGEDREDREVEKLKSWEDENPLMLKGEGNICQRLFIDCFFYVLDLIFLDWKVNCIFILSSYLPILTLIGFSCFLGIFSWLKKF